MVVRHNLFPKAEFSAQDALARAYAVFKSANSQGEIGAAKAVVLQLRQQMEAHKSQQAVGSMSASKEAEDAMMTALVAGDLGAIERSEAAIKSAARAEMSAAEVGELPVATRDSSRVSQLRLL